MLLLNKFVKGLTVSALAFSLAVSAVAAQEAPEEASENPVIAASAEGVTLPEGLTAGIVTFTMQNDNEAPFAPFIVRLKEDTTLDDFMAALQEGEEAALPLVVLVGGPNVAPESAMDVTYDLAAGEYVLLDFSSEMPSVVPFTVAEAEEGAEAAEAPEADVEVALVDFAFTLPTELEAGEQVWKLENLGEQWHEMAVVRIEEGVDIEELTATLMEMMMSEEGPGAELPFEEVFFWAPQDPGTTAWVTLDLEPGTYAVICFLPDFATGHSHLEHGMISILTVAE